MVNDQEKDAHLLSHRPPVCVATDRIFGSMDVSGDPESGNHKYLGIFMGTQDGTDAIFRKLRQMQIRMNEIKHKYRRGSILGGIRFDGSECIAFCVRIDRDPILSRVKQMRRSGKASEGRLRKSYHCILFHLLKDRIGGFALRHGVPIAEVPFQCDSDCRNFIRDAGLKQDREGAAHAIADIIAWANNRGMEPPGVISVDLSSELEARLAKQVAR